MNRRLITVLLCAFLVAGGCSLLVYRMIGARVKGAHRSTTSVVSAAADIKLGTILTASNLTTTEIAGTLPKGAIHKPENVIGRGVISDIAQGEPILESRLALVGSGGGLAAIIRKGMRACAVKVDEVVGVAGFVTPGMRVDVLVSGDPPGAGNSGTQVRTVLQNIEVLSAGTDIQKGEEGKPQQVRVVNLLVAPEQAEILSLASSAPGNKIQLVLRNPLDTDMSTVAGPGMAQMFNGAGAPAPAPKPATVINRVARQAPAVFSIEIYNGSQKSEQKFVSAEAN